MVIISQQPSSAIDLRQSVGLVHFHATSPAFDKGVAIYIDIAFAKLFGKRGFTIILAHYNGLLALVNTFGIIACDDLLSLPSSRDHINSFDTKVYHTSINHFDSRDSSATSI
jgi:hypothetical protein